MAAAVAEALGIHRLFYDAIETGDVDLMASLWADSAATICIHPGAAPLRGTASVLRTWTLLMANVGYIQFFLTDIEAMAFPAGSDDPQTVSINCTENILSGEGLVSADSFAGGKAIATTLLVRDGKSWKIWMRHASAADLPPNEGDSHELP